MQSDQDYTRFLVVGIGMNVNYAAEQMDASFRYPGTSIAMELKHSVPRQEILLAFLEEFEAQYDLFLEKGFESLMEVMEEYSIILRKTIRVQTSSGDLSGRVTGFNAQGALKLCLEDGKEETVWVGDVTHVLGDF
jgi:BirA family biotin operon repressor/biotin-[acetyl-CoA-carboxylase] ligase